MLDHNINVVRIRVSLSRSTNVGKCQETPTEFFVPVPYQFVAHIPILTSFPPAPHIITNISESKFHPFMINPHASVTIKLSTMDTFLDPLTHLLWHLCNSVLLFFRTYHQFPEWNMHDTCFCSPEPLKKQHVLGNWIIKLTIFCTLTSWGSWVFWIFPFYCNLLHT